MGKCLRGLFGGCFAIVMIALSACSSQVSPSITPTETATESQARSLATFDGTRVTVVPSETATASITPTATATRFEGIIPTPATSSPSPTSRNLSGLTVSPTNQPVPIFISTDFTQHVVQGGESLTMIANQYSVTVNQLLSTNSLSRSQVILVGQVISIPIVAPTSTPSPTIDTNDRPALIRQAIIGAHPTPLPNQVNNLDYDSFFLMSNAVIENVREIYEQGQILGRNLHAFTRIGDSTIEAPHFFYRFDEEDYNLGNFSYLQGTIDYYSGSFGHDSVAVIRGLHSWSVFDPMWSPRSCEVGEHMLACEIRLHNPSVIIIRLGTNDQGRADLTREHFVDIVRYCIENGVVPILGTKADRFDGASNSVNTIIRDIAIEYDIPLWDFDLIASTLPNHGLTADNVHLTYFYAHDWRLARGFTTGHGLHNLTGLIVLDELLQVLNDE